MDRRELVLGGVSKDLYLLYTPNRRLWLAVWQEWDGDEIPPSEVDLRFNDVWEFRYDNGRQRYLARQWTFVPEGNPQFTQIGVPIWTDYLGNQPHADFAVDPFTGQSHETMRYLAGFGVHAQQPVTGGEAGPPTFYHGDLTRSTLMTTNESASVLTQVAYTAFGEIVLPDGQGGWTVGGEAPAGHPRYGYDGGWGYESGMITLWGEDTSLPPIVLQHVGERWYDPGIGRFVQRDPIGILGGLNVYAYCHSEPTFGVDPSGLYSIWDGFKGAVIGFLTCLLTGSAPFAPLGAGIGAQNGWEWEDAERLGQYLYDTFDMGPMIDPFGPDRFDVDELVQDIFDQLDRDRRRKLQRH